MPQIYRTHTSPSFPFVDSNASRPHSIRRSSGIPQQPAPAITNADDNIVLSDLIRTGETSRLRRRGAMRLDHAPRPLSPPRPTTRPDDDDDSYAAQEWREWQAEAAATTYGGAGPLGPGGGTQLEDLRFNPDHGINEQPFMLFCGGAVRFDAQQPQRPFKPSILPTYPPPPLPNSTSQPTTNGCGALIHLRAFPQKPKPVWVGKDEATDVVVSLEAQYFESAVVAKMMKSACGCVREGVGCSVCGNPLGTRYMPCQAAFEGIFSTRPSRSPRPLHPSSPRYWNCRPALGRSHTWSPHRSDKRTSGHVYTFFSDHVHSTPIRGDTILADSPVSSWNTPPPLPPSFLALTPQPSATNTRPFTASPRPLSPRPLVPPPIQFYTDPSSSTDSSPEPMTRTLQDALQAEQGPHHGEELVLDADGVVVEDNDDGDGAELDKGEAVAGR
ncbi:hypothetical protein BXZ70DRAFT_906413 [Cristinia sonorae]|uniref:Uncharacterized protein n=1 Tax=Cristinia sonorae TaxID=1940300 RepID=A0A8K0XQU7_9AGAR|nr:hypothetical protein BXZ70DRAFT_906413 [Cristinia sonorae]